MKIIINPNAMHAIAQLMVIPVMTPTDILVVVVVPVMEVRIHH